MPRSGRSATPLIGLQVYDNRRAVDYLISRPEVDPTKLAITGASGGGNQTFYAGATDDRLAAVIPVCGIGTYASYLKTACCICEVNPGGASYATTGDLLAMVAPRALMVINATRDAVQFSVGEAAKSIAAARERFRLLGCEDRIRHVAIESGHDYNQPMREAMYGWVERWLRGRGDGQPIPEPAHVVEDVEALRCYPRGTARPKTVVTIPEFARSEGRERLKALTGTPRSSRALGRGLGTDANPASRPSSRGVSSQDAPGTSNEARPGSGGVRDHDGERHPLAWSRESGQVKSRNRPGIVLRAEGRTAIGIRRSGPGLTRSSRNGVGLGSARWNCRISEAPADGWPTRARWSGWRTTRWPSGGSGSAGLSWANGSGTRSDGSTCSTSCVSVKTSLQKDLCLPNGPYILVGLGTMSVPAILAAALDSRIAGVACSDCLVSYVGREAKPWSGVSMGLLAPGILDVGDVGHLAALVAPRPLVISSGVEPEGDRVRGGRLLDYFAYTRAVYGLLDAGRNLTLDRAAEVSSLIPG